MKRAESESFEAYRERRRHEAQRIKQHLRGYYLKTGKPVPAERGARPRPFVLPLEMNPAWCKLVGIKLETP